jgi:hypothetical protein
MTENRPITDLVRQGWSIADYGVTDMGGTTYCHNLLLTRSGQYKVVTIRKKIIGDGIVVEELDI